MRDSCFVAVSTELVFADRQLFFNEGTLKLVPRRNDTLFFLFPAVFNFSILTSVPSSFFNHTDKS